MKMASLAYVVLFGAIAREAYGVPLPPSDIKPFIVGGEDAPEAYAPYMVALIFGDRVKSHWCGGSLITRMFMLSAAACVEPFISDGGSLLETFQGRVGSNQWNSGGTIVKMKDYFMHPKWDSANLKYDLAVLVPREKLVLTEKVALIRLSFDVVADNERCLVTGWGRTGPRTEGNVVHMQPTPDNLQAIYTSILNHKLCQEQMTTVTNGRAPPVDKHVEICTFHSPGHGMCFGDSGSALVRNSSREQIGVVSWGYGCAHGAPDIFVSLSSKAIREFLEFFLNLLKD